MYAVKTGDRAGGFIIWIEEHSKGQQQAFLFCPSPMEAVFFTKSEVVALLKSRELDFVEVLPVDVYKISLASWEFYLRKQETICTPQT